MELETFFGKTYPVALNSRVRPHYVTILANLLTAKYTGKSRYGDPGTVQANSAAPTCCPLYYYEIEVIECESVPKIVAGFTNQSYHLHRNPGSEPNSIGYKAEDGLKLFGSGKAESYGPSYGKGDVVGCGINYLTQTYFFTKNGTLIGNSGPLNHTEHFPSVGLGAYGDSVTFNFVGPFRFNLEDLLEETRAAERKEINKVNVPLEVLNNLVHLYLVHGGYAETLRIFVQEAGSNPFKPSRPVDNNNEYADSYTSSNSISALVMDSVQFLHDGKANKKAESDKVLEDLYLTDHAVERMEATLDTRAKIQQLVLDGELPSAMDLVASTGFDIHFQDRLSEGYVMLATQRFIELLRNKSNVNRVNAAVDWMQGTMANLYKDPKITKNGKTIIETACGLLAYKDKVHAQLVDDWDIKRRAKAAYSVNEDILACHGSNINPLKILVQYLLCTRHMLRKRQGETGPIYTCFDVCRPHGIP